ncbi:MAG: cobalamin-binding protein [Dehalococcoidales bacterium]|nr:cobalamin-binding protein [Dehalococcoidales bacterium]
MRLVTLGIFVVLLSLFAACAPPAEEVVSSTMEVADQLGRVVKLDKIPERIISLSPSNTEILFALGLADKVVGVTEYCDYPEAAKTIDKIGGFSTVDLERVVALSPDLVLATEIHEARIIPKLKAMGLTVFALDPKTLGEVLESIALVGEVTGKGEEASQLVAEMRSRIKVVTDKTDNMPEAQRPRVFYITWHDPLMTPGAETRHNELIRMAGGTNIARDLSGYAAISLEAVIEANPQVIIAGVGMGSGEDLTFRYVETKPRLKSVDACINHKVYKIDVDLAGRPGPRITDALEQLAEFIHPELFKKD